MREQLKNKDRLVGLKQDKYGVYHLMEEGHFSEAGMNGNMPIFYMAFGRSLMVRLVTNWMGDDGWLRTRFDTLGVTQFENWVDTGEEYGELDQVAKDREAASAAAASS